ncbi:MAG: fasciclin domain-containing protein [Ilumatobacter sp.]|uniref:fasciclin domain-containing protein n=1 Tax=Ilumatobacter sp. TaxID=1967498 RepID=UPI00261E57C9|nr:fasciclin domain-containing protein [Ilumatobacter sp.]MDJ0769028.1 fasciclin domain-containing protein [Ilumatobacter sp.]
MAAERPAPRYRRRILGIGALAVFALYVIGAPFFVNSVEGDLERRVPDELAESGFDGVVAAFSGQDGTLTCAAPLDDPEAAISAAYDIRGVRSIDLDRSCRVNRAPQVDTSTTVAVTTPPDADVDEAAGADDAVDADAAAADGASAADETAPTTTVPPPDFATVGEIIATDPQFSLLAVLVQDASLAAVLDGADPVTLFAPTDDAFDALPADAIAQLQADPELLSLVLSHHTVAGLLTADDLVDGPLETQSGSAVELSVGDELVTVDGMSVSESDIVAGNGVVHVIDGLLLPGGVDLTAPEPLAAASAMFDGGAVTLDGVVASEVERAVLVAAATAALGEAGVVDNLEVDPDVGLDAETTAALAQLVTAMPPNLVTGVAAFDGSTLSVGGVFVTEAGRDALEATAASVGATTSLEPPPEATEEDAVDLEAELNDFVAANPILFQPTSSVLDASAGAVLDELASRLQQFSGVAVTVEGHTDSDGAANENLVLSQLRAIAVRDALVERGIAAETITAQGFGSERPVLVDGVEDKAASRRVEFRVVTVS